MRTSVRPGLMGGDGLSVTSFPVEEATIEGIHSAMLAGELRCRTLVEAYLRRIEALDHDGPRLNAIVSMCGQALGRAEELDEELAATRRLSGPLHGIPLLVKDCIETVDAPTTFCSIATADYMARQDAEVVRRLRTAGSVILAKTTLCDFGAGWFSYSSRSGDTKNPYAPERDSGGSSAGSASGVAANFATASVGTDCGGSIRVPASFCNLVSLRPTVGTVSRTGSLPRASCIRLRGAGPSRPSPTSSTSTRSTGATTSPPGKSRTSSRPRYASHSGHCVDRHPHQQRRLS
jgi:amidase